MAASSQVNYGLTTGYGTASSSAALVTSHSITLSGLTAEATYHFQVQSVDAQGNTATSSDQTFTTTAVFSPADLSPALWLATDDLTTLFQSNAGSTAVASDGNPVGYWGDKSGNAFNLTSTANDTTRPTYNTSSGLSWVTFNGTNSSLQKTAALGLYNAGTASVFMAVRGNPGTGAYLLDETNSASANAIYAPLKSDSTTATTNSPFARNDTSGVILNALPATPNAYNNSDHVIGIVDDGSSFTVYVDGAPQESLLYTRSGISTLNSFGLGSYFRTAASNWWNGRIYNVVATKSVLTTQQINNLTLYQASKAGLSVTLPSSLIGNNSAYFTNNQYITIGSNLTYEYTQPWSAMARIKMYEKPATAAIIFSNVTSSGLNYPGYELWVDSSGFAHVRIINNITTHFIGVAGTINVADGNVHTVLASYDGSGTAAGVKIYVDGVLETMTTESDNLGGNSITGGTHEFYIGNQKNHLNFFFEGLIDNFRLSNVVRNATYMSTYANGQAPVDANTVAAYNFEEGTGLTTADSSASGFNGTLSSASIWMR